MHCVDLGESFQTHILLQNLASIQPRKSPVKFARPITLPSRSRPALRVLPRVNHRAAARQRPGVRAALAFLSINTSHMVMKSFHCFCSKHTQMESDKARSRMQRGAPPREAQRPRLPKARCGVDVRKKTSSGLVTLVVLSDFQNCAESPRAEYQGFNASD